MSSEAFDPLYDAGDRSSSAIPPSPNPTNPYFAVHPQQHLQQHHQPPHAAYGLPGHFLPSPDPSAPDHMARSQGFAPGEGREPGHFGGNGFPPPDSQQAGGGFPGKKQQQQQQRYGLADPSGQQRPQHPISPLLIPGNVGIGGDPNALSPNPYGPSSPLPAASPALMVVSARACLSA